MRYQIKHETILEFEGKVFEQAGELRLMPRIQDYQTVLSFDIKLEPATELFHYDDAYGNRVDYFSILAPHQSLKIQFQAEVENRLANPFDFLPLEPKEEYRRIENLLNQEPRMNDFVLSSSRTVPSLPRLNSELVWPKRDSRANLLESIQAAMAWIAKHFTYVTGATQVHCPFDEVVAKRAGVCQDFSHLLIAIARSWGVPARYVMGYQYLSPEALEKQGSATHAWTEIYIPDQGWQGFDATQQLLANQSYIPVAVGRDSHDAAPQRGCYKGGAAGIPPKIELMIVAQQ